MGGLFVVAALVASVLLFGDLGNRYLAAAMVVAVGLALVGIVDDLVKIRSAAKGLSARHKLIAQLLVAAAAALLLYRQQAAVPDGLLLRLPLAGTSFSLGLWFIPSAIVVIVGASNAVNLDRRPGRAGRRMPDRRHRRHDRAGLRRRTRRLGRVSRRAAHSRMPAK